MGMTIEKFIILAYSIAIVGSFINLFLYIRRVKDGNDD